MIIFQIISLVIALIKLLIEIQKMGGDAPFTKAQVYEAGTRARRTRNLDELKRMQHLANATLEKAKSDKK